MTRHTDKSTRLRGFTMIEVLFAIGIFAIGFAMVATIFPAAVLIQKNTIDDVTSQQVARNAEAMLKGRGVTEASLTDTTNGLPAVSPSYDTDRRIHRFPPAMLRTPPTPPLPSWAIQDRSFPTTITNANRRRHYWVPLIRDDDAMVGAPHRWEVYVFILQRRDGGDYQKTNPNSWANPDDGTPVTIGDPNPVPGVRVTAVTIPSSDDTRMNFPNQDFDDNGVNDPGLDPDDLLVQIGNEILDSNGIVQSVVLADSGGVNVSSPIPGYPSRVNRIWYGPPDQPGHKGTTQRILILADNVVN